MVTSTTLASGVKFYYIAATNAGDTRLISESGVQEFDDELSAFVNADDLAILPNLFLTLFVNGNTLPGSRVEFKLIVIGMLQ